MTSRWVLVFDLAARHAPTVAHRLRHELDAVVALDEVGPGRALLSIEVDARQDVVLEVSQLVRSFDVDAERLHDVVVQEPPLDREPVTVHIDYDAGDEPSPCPSCAQWRHEVVTAPSGVPVLREWHRAACPTYLASL